MTWATSRLRSDIMLKLGQHFSDFYLFILIYYIILSGTTHASIYAIDAVYEGLLAMANLQSLSLVGLGF